MITLAGYTDTPGEARAVSVFTAAYAEAVVFCADLEVSEEHETEFMAHCQGVARMFLMTFRVFIGFDDDTLESLAHNLLFTRDGTGCGYWEYFDRYPRLMRNLDNYAQSLGEENILYCL